jgi:hypothetical protein
MDTQSKVRLLLAEASPYLPGEVVSTAGSLNDHGEWELAFSHCQFHLAMTSFVPDSIRLLASECDCQIKAEQNEK